MMLRREILGVLGATGIVAASGLKAQSKQEGNLGDVHEDCLKACEACERSCNKTFQYCCLQVAAGKKEYAQVLHLVVDCGKFCDLSADLIASESPLMVHSCLACVEACIACARECDKFDSGEMKLCVNACRECEATCRAMVKAMEHDRHG